MRQPLDTVTTPGQARSEPAWQSKRRRPISTEQNKTLVRRYWEEVWNNGNLAVVDELIATDFDGHPLTGEPDFGRGLAGQKQLVGMYRTAFPDLHMTIEDLTAEGDRIAVRLDRARHPDR